jgi:membrane associated rhomboid family serine protease
MDNSPISFSKSLLPSLFILLIIWLFFYLDNHYKLQLYNYGLQPRKIIGIIGIFTMPFIHGDVIHILSNTFPFLILLTLLNFNYSEISIKVLKGIYLISGCLIWCFADLDENTSHVSYHIGASGIIYGLSGFLFFSGIIRKRKDLFAVSLLVTFLYGTLIWGVFPENFQRAIHYISSKDRISWEGHLFGFLSGSILAFLLKSRGKQEPVYSWEKNNDEDVDESNPYWIIDENEKVNNNS